MTKTRKLLPIVSRGVCALVAPLLCALLLQACSSRADRSLEEAMSLYESHFAAVEASAVSCDGKAVPDFAWGINKLYPVEHPALPSPPKGYEPVHISHYGRHGSRYLRFEEQFHYVAGVLEKAAAEGRLTPAGEELRERYAVVFPLLSGRGGELSEIGGLQHRGIAARMVERYPALFRDGARIEATSTYLERTMLSMLNFTRELTQRNPLIDLRADASRVLMGALNPHSAENVNVTPSDELWKSLSAPWRPDYDRYCETLIDWDAFAARLFTSTEGLCSPMEFGRDLFFITLNVPNSLSDAPSFFDMFTSEELMKLGEMENCCFYIEKSRYPGGDRRGCFLAETLLTDFIERVQDDLARGVTVRLRFGHDGCLMSLFALMQLPGWDAEVTDFSRIPESWDISRIPMAGNVQLVFFAPGGRRDCSSSELLFLPLMNEEPGELPLEQVCEGFYRWSDFVALYSEKIIEARRELGIL
ncbi:MAG: hypothetical protein IJS66_01620 [Bacteroidales bacterium]|nr:hypothetical protein [Bacteroidales bacterium]